jgi:hypothetical protein
VAGHERREKGCRGTHGVLGTTVEIGEEEEKRTNPSTTNGPLQCLLVVVGDFISSFLLMAVYDFIAVLCLKIMHFLRFYRHSSFSLA